MNAAFRVRGNWPSPITFSRGWARAVARPWNDEAPDAFVRLERGRSDFLRSATETVASMSGSGVFSPAMFSPAMRVWIRAGYEEVRHLEVMERPLGASIEETSIEIEETTTPDWARLLQIDRAAFEGFWRMSLDGLKEALASTDPSSVLTARVDGRVAGYAIVGTQWGTSYLQRVAVDPDRGGRGIGTGLVTAAVRWARKTAAASMVLNVRPENVTAKRIYERSGFSTTGRHLRILRFGDTRLLSQ